MSHPSEKKSDEKDRKSQFFVMQIAAWAGLCIGAALCLFNFSNFSDSNISLMAGLGCLVGSVFIYTIGTAMNLVQKRKYQSDNK